MQRRGATIARHYVRRYTWGILECRPRYMSTLQNAPGVCMCPEIVALCVCIMSMLQLIKLDCFLQPFVIGHRGARLI